MGNMVVVAAGLLVVAWVVSVATGISFWLLSPAVIPVLTVIALARGRTRSLDERNAAQRAGVQARLDAGSATSRNYRHGVGAGDGQSGGLS